MFPTPNVSRSYEQNTMMALSEENLNINSAPRRWNPLGVYQRPPLVPMHDESESFLLALTGWHRTIMAPSSTLRGFSIDVDAIERELEHGKKDTESIRKDFMRNGIDSPVGETDAGLRRSTMEARKFKWNCNAADPIFGEGNEKAKCSKKLLRRLQKENETHCVFCYNNGEQESVYLSHTCRDEQGLVSCPRLRHYVCPYCKATDKHAHTKKYCPKKPIITPADLEHLSTSSSNSSGDNSSPSKSQEGLNKTTHREKRVLRF